MSIPPNSPCRGCSSSFAQPVSQKDVEEAQNMVKNVHRVNCIERNPPLANIVYRTGEHNSDVKRCCFRWSIKPYDEIFQNGFRARAQEDTSPNNTYYDLYDYVHNADAPILDPNKPPRRHAFVSTTIDVGWRPDPNHYTLLPIPTSGNTIQIYRYEVYAPGGIWVSSTLGNVYRYADQHQVCFVGGIAPQYIRSAQLFTATRPAGARHATIRREGTALIINRHFDPLSDPDTELLIQNPLLYYCDDGIHRPLSLQTFTAAANMKRERQVSNHNWDALQKWYVDDVPNVPSYINAAFPSSKTNEAYIFMKNEYVRLNYVNDWIVNGPLLICDGFPSLIGTSFGEHGIDCAFDTDNNEAFIFSSNLCAYIDYAPGTKDDKILSGPTTITAMFPSLKNTVFENGIDAAFRSTLENEAYLFRGDQYAQINYNSKHVIAMGNISGGFYGLMGTIFASGIDAAFAVHWKDEAYIFKGEYYARFNFAPAGTTSNHIPSGVKPILPNWPSLSSILPIKNGGLDDHHHREQVPWNPGHDEL
ncbi:uncharacterized protein LOC133293962 [Gastrolobium bilobum]|uniref:uncharacterized protein LOC133293962 n=1 Tax=Gastrolobium bilobum TaxID=150636 RepID=UPI002AB01F61|nr:uncharacterized protein LOC133293962 [Gastrolobium bilobum]